MSAAPILTILKNGETIQSQPLEGEVLLGRSEGCVIRLEDRAISRQHAVFRAVAGGVQVEKKSDVAPLSVNGTECTSAVIKEGDVIEIGPYRVKLSMAGVSAESAPGETVSLDSLASDSALPSLDSSVSEAPALDAISIVAPEGDGASPGIDLASAMPEEPKAGFEQGVPDFSLNQPAVTNSGPVDLGEVSIDEDAQTKLVSAAKVAAKLVLPEGTANVTELEISKDEISIGRGKDCDVVLDDKKASRKHAIIRRAGVNFTIKDLGSANGTYVNNVKVEEQELSGDDILRIGNVEFRFLVLSQDYVDKQDGFIPVPRESSAPSLNFSQRDLAPEGMPSAEDIVAMGSLAPNAGVLLDPAAQGVQLNSIPGIAGIPGLAGASSGKQSLWARYKALPPRRKAIWTAVLIVAAYFLLFPGEEQKPHPKKNTAVVAGAQIATFESLTPEQKKFVESQHALAFDYYKNRDYDKALFEIQKIFALIPDYKDSREIERYAKEGKRKLEALEEEKRKKEEEEKLKAQVAELVDQAKQAMDAKKYDAARDLFPQILSLDPDNQQVTDWRKLLDRFDEDKRMAEQEKSVQEQINVRAWDLYKEGLGLKKNGKYHEAIDAFRKVFEIGATDKKPEKLAKHQIHATEALISKLRDPVLAEAKEAEDAQDFTKAFGLYKKATEIDPPYPAGYAGMDRIRGILHDRAKALYIDAVLSESYSDFDTAKKKYQECLEVAPNDDVYHDRAARRLATFFKPKEDQPQQ